jgi:hypothetical protein
MERPSKHQLSVTGWKFEVYPLRATFYFRDEASGIRQMLDDMRSKDYVASTVRNRHRQGISFNDGHARELHRLVAVQALVKGMFFNDKIRPPEGSMSTPHIDDKIGFGDIDVVQNFLTRVGDHQRVSDQCLISRELGQGNAGQPVASFVVAYAANVCNGSKADISPYEKTLSYDPAPVLARKNRRSSSQDRQLCPFSPIRAASELHRWRRAQTRPLVRTLGTFARLPRAATPNRAPGQCAPAASSSSSSF